MKQKYIMSEEEYEALDTYLTAAKMYDADCYICQLDGIDYGFYADTKEVRCLKQFINELYYDNYPEDLIGYKGFTKSMMKVIDKLYEKLEDIDDSLLPTPEESWQLILS